MDVALIGVSLKCSGAKNIDEFVSNLRNKKQTISQPSKDRKSNFVVSHEDMYYPTGYIDKIDKFDHLFFNISKQEADAIDPGQRIILELVCEAIESSGYRLEDISGSETGLFITINDSHYNLLYTAQDSNLDFIGGITALGAGRIAHFLGIEGPVLNIDTACSSSLVAIHEAVRKMRSGEINLGIVGGARVNHIFPSLDDVKGDVILSSDGVCRAFDDSSNGTVPGEGAAFIVLKPLEKAIRDKDHIISVIKGSAVNHKGNRSNSLFSPSPVSQKKLIISALQDAKVDINSVEYIETHGTGTKIGDPIEYKAIKDVFGSTGKDYNLNLGTLKPNIGHTDNMSGLFGFIKASFSVYYKEFFPLLNFNELNQLINSDERIVLNSEGGSWFTKQQKRKAGISSFGISGTDAHVIIEEYLLDKKFNISENREDDIFLKVSAKSKKSLKVYVENLISFFSEKNELRESTINFNRGRSDYKYKFSVVGKNREELVDNLNAEYSNIDKIKGLPEIGKTTYIILSDDIKSGIEKQIYDSIFDNIYKELSNKGSVSNDFSTELFITSFYKYLTKKGFIIDGIVSIGKRARNTRSFIQTNDYKFLQEEVDIEESSIDFEKLEKYLKSIGSESIMLVGSNSSNLEKIKKWSHQKQIVTIDINQELSVSAANLWRKLYNLGFSFNWNEFYQNKLYQKQILPTYPFEDISCWNKNVNPLFFKELKIDEKDENIKEDLKLSDYKTSVLSILESIFQDSVSLDDDFFELGGNSIIGIQFINRINDLYSIDIEFDELYDCLTIKEIVELVRVRSGSDSNVIQEISNPSINFYEDTDFLELTTNQKRIWIESQDVNGSIANNVNNNFLIEGSLNIQHLKRAISEVIKSNDVFRLYFTTEEKKGVVQKLLKIDDLLFDIPVHDGSQMSEEKIYSFIKGVYNNAIDIDNGPLYRFEILKISENSYYLIMSVHHIIFDGWSWGVLIKELLDIYTKLVKDEEYTSIDKYSYVRYLVNRDTISDRYLSSKDYWKDKLVGKEITNFKLNSDDIKGKSGKRISYPIKTEVFSLLRKIVKEKRTTLFVVLLSSIRSYLFKLTERNITIGTPVSGRIKKEYEKTLGLFINTLPLYSEFSTNLTLEELLKIEHETVEGALTHQSYSYDDILTDLRLNKDDLSSLFDTLVVLQNQNNRFDLNIENKLPLSINEGLEIDELKTTFNLTFNFLYDDDLVLDFIYNDSLFSDVEAQAFLNNYSFFLEELLKNYKTSIKKIEYVCEKERKKIQAFNLNTSVYPEDKNITHLFEDIVNKFGDKLAVTYEGKEYSYEELNQQVNQYANCFLEKFQLKTGDLVVVFLPKSYNSLISILSILKIGGVFLPIDISYPKDRLLDIIVNGDVKAIITQGEFLKEDVDPVKINIDQIEFASYSKEFNYKIEILPSDLAYVIYTSGSTGTPKGVMVKHNGVINMALHQIREFGVFSNDRVVWFASVSFDASVSEIMMSILSGACLIIPTEELKYNKDHFSNFLIGTKSTIITLPPSYLDLLDVRKISKNVRTIITAGESAHVIKANEVISEGMNYFNAYGPTEYSVCISIYKLENTTNEISIPIGKPISNTEVYILDNYNKIVPIGVEGRLYVSGVGLAKGYLNNESLTKDKFIENPFGTGLMYDTGDNAKWLSDGNIEFIGRSDGQVKISGYRIELEEIQNVFLQLEEIKQVVVLAETFNQDKKLVAYYVFNKEFKKSNLDKRKLKENIKRYLPSYMVPSYYKEISEIHYTTNGKVDKSKLPNLNSDDLIVNEYMPPENHIQVQLIDIWKEVLKVNKIGINDNFFELGGTSILAIRTLAKINKLFKTDYPLNTLFHLGSIKKISIFIAKGKSFEEEYYVLGNPKSENIIFGFPPILGYGSAYEQLFKNIDVKLISFNFLENKSIEFYTEKINELQPTGDIVLFGWSAGGNLSYKIELELREHYNRNISNIIMLDSYSRFNTNWKEEFFDIKNHMYYDLELEQVILDDENILKKVESKIFKYLKIFHEITYDNTLPSNLVLIKSTEPMADYFWSSVFKNITTIQGMGKHYEMLEPNYVNDNSVVVRDIIHKIFENKKMEKKVF